MNFLSVFTQFCDVTVRVRLIPVTAKAKHIASTHNISSEITISAVDMCFSGSFL